MSAYLCPYLNALALIERFGRDLAEVIKASDMEAGAKEASVGAIDAMLLATEIHRALLEASEQPRLH